MPKKTLEVEGKSPCQYKSDGCTFKTVACDSETEQTCGEAGRRESLKNEPCPIRQKNNFLNKYCDIPQLRALIPDKTDCGDCILRKIPGIQNIIKYYREKSDPSTIKITPEGLKRAKVIIKNHFAQSKEKIAVAV